MLINCTILNTQRLATGGFGIVSRVRRAVDGKVLVWKELNYARMNKKERRMMITEVNILRDIDHKHVVKYYDTIIVREQQKIYLIIEHCAKGDMGALIETYKKKKRRMDEAFIWRVLGQILLGVCLAQWSTCIFNLVVVFSMQRRYPPASTEIHKNTHNLTTPKRCNHATTARKSFYTEISNPQTSFSTRSW